MRRRDILALLGGVAAEPVLRSLAANAQQTATPLIGFLGSESSDLWTNRLARFGKASTRLATRKVGT